MEANMEANIEAEPTVPGDDEETPLEEAFLTYRDAGLRLPPVPRELAESLEQFGEWHFATESGSLTDRASLMEQAGRAETLSQVGFGYTGHGLASWWLCYRLILDSLAVFVRLSLGSPYAADADSGRDAANQAMKRIEELIVAAGIVKEAGLLKPGQRLLAVSDDLEGSGWKVTGGEWNPTLTPLEDALAFLASNGEGK